MDAVNLGSHRPNRVKAFLLTTGLFILTSLPMVSYSNERDQRVASANSTPQSNDPRIQIAILLDTSNSMDGLIDQTRNQLWTMVNEFSKAKRNGRIPILEVAIYEYGNDSLAAQTGHIRKVTHLTRELDRVSEALYSLTTNGGSEFCGYVIDAAVKELQWSQASQDIRAIFIAGNEPFNQGSVPYEKAIALAKSKDIVVHTIFAGDNDEGRQSGWQQGALLAGGNYMSIDSNQKIAHIVAPQDAKIAELNHQLNQTYLPYGAEGEKAIKRQEEQDRKSTEVSIGLMAQRAKSKASAAYQNSNWDLVDAVADGAVKIEELDEKALPKPMTTMNTEEKNTFIKAKQVERKKIQEEITDLTKARDSFVAAEKSKAAKEQSNTINDALSSAVREQGKKKKFVFHTN